MDNLLIKECLPTKFEASIWCKVFLSYQLHKIWTINMTFDLNINRDHLLIKDYLPSKFEASRGKVFFSYQLHKVRGDRPTDRQTDGHVQRNMPSFFKGVGA